MKKNIIIFLICLLCGCSVLKKSVGSQDGLDASDADATVLAAQTADILSRRYAPAHTSLVLHKAPGVYGDALEAHLRAKGFTLAPVGSRSAFGVVYTVGMLEDKEAVPVGYVEVSHADGWNFSFSRRLSLAGPPKVIPASAGPFEVPLPKSETSRPKPPEENVLPASEPARIPPPATDNGSPNPPPTKPEASAPDQPKIVLDALNADQDPSEPVSMPLWEIIKGEKLRGRMEAWASEAGYSLIWSAENDYEMNGSASFSGEFIDAVKSFFAALQANGIALRVTIYEGNRVVEVSEH